MNPSEPQNQNPEQQPQTTPEPVQQQPPSSSDPSESVNGAPTAVDRVLSDQPVATASPFAQSNPAADPSQISAANQNINFIGGCLLAAGIANTIITVIILLRPAPWTWSPMTTPISLSVGLILAVLGVGLMRKNKIAYIAFYVTLLLIAASFAYNIFYIFGLLTILPFILALGGVREIGVWAFILQFGLYLLLGIFFVVAGILMRKKNIQSQFRL